MYDVYKYLEISKKQIIDSMTTEIIFYNYILIKTTEKAKAKS